jgi:hypothetical protein
MASSGKGVRGWVSVPRGRETTEQPVAEPDTGNFHSDPTQQFGKVINPIPWVAIKTLPPYVVASSDFQQISTPCRTSSESGCYLDLTLE